MSARNDRAERAVELRAQGCSYAEIARALGVARSTARRLANPEENELHLRQSREAKRRRRTPCPQCGELVSYDRSGGSCAQCLHDMEYASRNARIFEAWERGDTAFVIAAREGMNASAVATLVDHHRRRYGTSLPLHRVPNRTHWEHIRRRWNEEGATLNEIAAELGYSRPQNISEQIVAMRKAGIEMQRRRLPAGRAA